LKGACHLGERNVSCGQDHPQPPRHKHHRESTDSRPPRQVLGVTQVRGSDLGKCLLRQWRGHENINFSVDGQTRTDLQRAHRQPVRLLCGPAWDNLGIFLGPYIKNSGSPFSGLADRRDALQFHSRRVGFRRAPHHVPRANHNRVVLRRSRCRSKPLGDHFGSNPSGIAHRYGNSRQEISPEF